MIRRFSSLLLVFLLFGRLVVRADSSVVFNEIMYHPAANEPALEWVELYNQMAVDVDLSGWALDGAVQYQFGSNSVLKGRSYLVIAASPALLASSANITNTVGPFSSTNQLPNGKAELYLRNNNRRVVNDMTYDVGGDWPVAPDGGGVSLAKFDPETATGKTGNWTWSDQVGGTPGRTNFPGVVTPVTLAFNEITSATSSNFWIEIINYGTNPISLGGHTITRKGVLTNICVLPASQLAAGAASILSTNTLGFQPASGDRLFLLNPGGTRVLDGLIVKNSAKARAPDGTGEWCNPTLLTPAGSNSVVFRTELVINEVMYKHQPLPITNNLPADHSNEEWIEIYNRSTNSVDMTGWQLGGGISFRFPAGKIVQPGGYLVVAANAASLRASYPAIDMVGNFSGALKNGSDTIVLEDANGNPADRLRYYDKGRWPAFADGGGSSLELRDPFADKSRPEAWAASDESTKSEWQNFTYDMVAQTGNSEPDLWDDFIFGLLADGECLIDDISVIESPNTSANQMIANGDFEAGLSGWRPLGNHITSRVETDPGNSGNHVLHLIATGPLENSGNHLERTCKSSITDGRTYRISFRAKWINGVNLLNTRLYFNRAARTSVLPTPQLNGTPGAQNSRYAGNLGPTYSGLRHSPVIPAASQAVTVSVVAQDPQGLASCQLWWSTNGANYSSAAMSAKPGGLFTGTIPKQKAGAIVHFFVRATDVLGAVSTCPAGGTNSGALFMVADGKSDLSLGHNFRVIVTPPNWGLLRADTNLVSSQNLPGTLIYDESRCYYDVGIRLKGSPMGRYRDTRASFRIEFQPDDLFRGEHPVLLLDCSGRADVANQQEEIVVHHMANHAGGIPAIHSDMAWVIPPMELAEGPATVYPRFEDDFIQTAFKNGSDGLQWLYELIYYQTTQNGDGYKLPDSVSILESEIGNRGTNKEAYRHFFQIKSQHAQDDFRGLISFAEMMSLPTDPTQEAQSRLLMDVDQWLRTFAYVSLLGETDFYGFGNKHNLHLYLRPEDNRMLVFPWDVEQLFRRSPIAPLNGESYFGDIADLPSNKRRLYAHALDIMASTYNTNYMSRWVEHFSSLAPGQDYSDLLDYMTDRTAGVLAEIEAAGGNTPFEVTTTNYLETSNNLVELTGTAPVQVAYVRVNGVDYPVTWNSISNWTISLPVIAGTNTLQVLGYDLAGHPLTDTATTITINFTGEFPNPARAVVINEIYFNPIVTNAAFVELLNTSTSTTFDLSNWRLEGLDYTFPPGSLITNGQHLLLVADPGAFVAEWNAGIVPFDFFHGKLQGDGEKLSLTMPGPLTNQPIIVDQVRYSAFLPWPATVPGKSLQLIDSAQDNGRVANWSAATPSPGSPNSVARTLPAFQPLWLNELQAENLTGPTNLAGQHKAWFELHNSGTTNVPLSGLYLSGNYSNLSAWTIPAGQSISPGGFKVIFADGQTSLTTSNELHTPFVLPPGSGSLALSRLQLSSVRALDFVTYTNLSPNRSFGSLPDGQSFDRQDFFYVTPGGTNDGRSALLTVVINEWQAVNNATLTNPVSGKFSDWFELHNYGTNPANLSGYYLTDVLTNKFKYEIPFGYVIPPGGFLLCWADDRNTNGTPDLHVSFKMSATGESLGLFGPDGTAVDFVNYGPQLTDVSEGRYPDGAITLFSMPTATPRTNNLIPNTPPMLLPMADQFLHAGQTLRLAVKALDAESFVQTLLFSLDPVAPAGAFIVPETGYLTWTASVEPPYTNSFTVRVTDNGTPPAFSTASFQAIVLPPPIVNGLAINDTLLTVSFTTVPGQLYQLQYKVNLNDSTWTTLGFPLTGTGGVLQVFDDITGQPQRFYRVLVTSPE